MAQPAQLTASLAAILFMAGMITACGIPTEVEITDKKPAAEEPAEEPTGQNPDPNKKKKNPDPKTPNNNKWQVHGEGDRLEFELGRQPSGSFHFEAKGFDDRKYSTGDSELKPVFFWLYNGSYSYSCSGLLFEVRQYLYKGYYCRGGKIKARNGGDWRGEECYDVDWAPNRWYGFDIEWSGGVITLSVDGRPLESLKIGSVNGKVIAGIGWPPDRRQGIEGLKYRNWSFK